MKLHCILSQIQTQCYFFILCQKLFCVWSSGSVRFLHTTVRHKLKTFLCSFYFKIRVDRVVHLKTDHSSPLRCVLSFGYCDWETRRLLFLFLIFRGTDFRSSCYSFWSLRLSCLGFGSKKTDSSSLFNVFSVEMNRLNFFF